MDDIERAAKELAEKEYPRSYLYKSPKEINELKKILRKAEEDGLMEAIKKEEDKRAAGLLYPGNEEPTPFTDSDYKIANKVLKKKGVSQKTLDELNK